MFRPVVILKIIFNIKIAGNVPVMSFLKCLPECPMANWLFKDWITETSLYSVTGRVMSIFKVG
jgi:hypothetical protein